MSSPLTIHLDLERIRDQLLREPEGRSCTYVVPPGFGEDARARKLKALILEHCPNALVAVLTADEFANPLQYVTTLHDRWSSDDIPLTPLRQGDAKSVLDGLIENLPTDVPVIQILGRFHTAIHTLGQMVLGTLRAREEECKLYSVVLTPYPRDWVRTIWSSTREGQILTTSNYGDIHFDLDAQLPSLDDLVVSTSQEEGMTPEVASYICGLTGGHPDSHHATVLQWRDLGRGGDLSPDVRRALKTAAANKLRGFIKNIDKPGIAEFREAVLGIHLEDRQVPLHCDKLREHPWANHILLDGGNTFRANALGDAAATTLVTDSATDKSFSTIGDAQKYYFRGAFQQAANTLSGSPFDYQSPEFLIARAHSNVMAKWHAIEMPGQHSDWSSLNVALTQAEQTLEGLNLKPAVAKELREVHYSPINSFTSDLVTAAKIATSEHDDRIVDVLVGLLGDAKGSAKSLVCLLDMMSLEARKIPGHGAAVCGALPLPEQLFRIWAFWTVDTNFYSYSHSADASDDAWKRANDEWNRGPSDEKVFDQPHDGNPFNNFPSFAHYCMALAIDDPKLSGNVIVEGGFDNLRSCLGFLNSCRNPRAHSICSTRVQTRKTFFEISERWLKAVRQAADSLGLMTLNYDPTLFPWPLLDSDGEILDLSEQG